MIEFVYIYSIWIIKYLLTEKWGRYIGKGVVLSKSVKFYENIPQNAAISLVFRNAELPSCDSIYWNSFHQTESDS